MNRAPVGVMDSGVGGLSVLHHIRELLPAEDLLYVADSAHAPYGAKTPEQILARTRLIAEFLLAQGAKALVVACNTATAAAAAGLRQQFAVPIIAMEPAVKPAVAATQTGVVGVLATVGTLKSAQFAALLESYGHGVRVVTQAGVGLVEQVEQGVLDGSVTRQLLMTYLQPLLDEGADTLVLGCTHYPFLRPAIESLLQGRMVIIDTGAAVARHLANRMAELGLLAYRVDKGTERFWTSVGPEQLPQSQQVIQQLWGRGVVQLNAF